VGTRLTRHAGGGSFHALALCDLDRFSWGPTPTSRPQVPLHGAHRAGETGCPAGCRRRQPARRPPTVRPFPSGFLPLAVLAPVPRYPLARPTIRPLASAASPARLDRAGRCPSGDPRTEFREGGRAWGCRGRPLALFEVQTPQPERGQPAGNPARRLGCFLAGGVDCALTGPATAAVAAVGRSPTPTGTLCAH